jgi:DNA helicase-2/ATP-dependent DNA helicase PcrA
VSTAAVLAGLDPEQRAAVEAPVGPVCVLAGAGTGKTRAITHRIAYGVLTGATPPGQVLAVTFTARAAGELRDRLRRLGAAGVQARTFHAAGLRQLGYFWPQVLGGDPPRLVERKLPLVARAAGRLRTSLAGPELRDAASEIEWAKATLVGPESYPVAAAAAGRLPPRDSGFVAGLYAAYEEVKRADGLVDFDDLLLLTAAILEEHPPVAEEFRARYRHFLVDEYQDVTPLQQRLLDGWLGDRDSLCVVGDAHQTIYSFAGASSRQLLDFPARFPAATVVRLVRDYRSTPQVVGLANAVLKRARDLPRGARLQLVAQQPAGPEPVFLPCDDEPAEAAEVARRIAGLRAEGTPASGIAVLYRVNAQSQAYETALGAAGIPYLVRGGERFFDRREVREAVLLLRGAARAADVDRPHGLPAQVREVLVAAGWRPDEPPAGGGAGRERWENLAALARLADDLAAGRPEADLGEIVALLAERAAAQHAPTVEGVTLASLHAAKGLEWDAVFLVGLVDGTLPIVHATTDAQIEEERRLFYVGVTRARRVLVLSWSAARGPGSRRTRRPCPFLDGLRPPAPRRARAVRGPAAEDAGLYEALRAWRSARAGELGQPAYCVFSDATLAAIAERRPVTPSELARLPGIGPMKLDRYGREVLALVGRAGDPPPPG